MDKNNGKGAPKEKEIDNEKVKKFPTFVRIYAFFCCKLFF